MTARSPTDIDRMIGSRIRVRRLAIGVSQTALADALGVTFQQVQKYENGMNRISAGHLVQAADALGMPVAQFFDGLGDGAAPHDDPVSSMLATRDGRRLAQAFAGMPGPLRAALVGLVESAHDAIVSARE